MELIKEIESRRDNKGHLRKWGLFKCPDSYCGKEVERPLSNGVRYVSCGCNTYKERKGNPKHNGHGTRLYVIWQGIIQRCNNSKNKAFKNYGGRGITLCPEWTGTLNGFINFRDWALSNGYKDNLEIDRKENNGNYEPNNCKWDTTQENCRHRRTTKIKSMEIANEIRYLYNNGEYTQQELAKMYGVSIGTISNIINNKQWRN